MYVLQTLHIGRIRADIGQLQVKPRTRHGLIGTRDHPETLIEEGASPGVPPCSCACATLAIHTGQYTQFLHIPTASENVSDHASDTRSHCIRE
jgi:hypothetical protein